MSLIAAGLLALPVGGSPAAAGGPSVLKEPAPSLTRGPEPKGAGSPAASQPTGRLIVRYRAGLSDAARQRARAVIGARFVSQVALPDTELLDPISGVAAAVAAGEGQPDVVSVEPEFRRTLAAGPVSEPLIGQQWTLKNTGQVVQGYPGAVDVDMNVIEAWGVTTGSPAVVVGVIDDGVDLSHPDLSGRAWVNPGEIAANGLDDDANGLIDDVNGWDFCNNDNTVHDAEDFHGTHVAGSIAASGNGIGIAGVAPTVQIMALKFVSPDPSCGTDTQAIAAIDYAVSHGAQVINASWGGPDYSQALSDSIWAASSALVVAAAGNDNVDIGTHPIYPASYELDNVLAVASIHNQGALSDFSNYGPWSVDIAAPGEDIISTLPGGSYGYLSGTSMAAANTSGVGALAASAHPSLAGNGAGLRNHLIDTARALPSTLGWLINPRMVDARAAVVSRPDIRRLFGADRYATSVAISLSTFTPNVPYLFVATGQTFPDALAGAAVAAKVGAPLLLVRVGSIPAATLSEIQRLKPYHIFVLGGTGVVSDAVLSQLAAYDNPGSTGPYRLAGADRYATAVAISQAAFDPSNGFVFIANGTDFPDALAGGPVAASRDGPILLTKATSIPLVTKNELNRLHPAQIVVLGGTGAVSKAVADELQHYAQFGVQRWAGADRYATAVAIAEQTFFTAATILVAAGYTFPDALSGGPAAGAYFGPLLLTRQGSIPDATKQELVKLQPVRIFVLGGSGAVSDAVVSEIGGLFP